MSIEYPPKFVGLLIRDFSGKIIAGTITSIDHRQKIVRVSDVSILEIVGLKHGLEPIYDKRKIGRFHLSLTGNDSPLGEFAGLSGKKRLADDS